MSSLPLLAAQQSICSHNYIRMIRRLCSWTAGGRVTVSRGVTQPAGAGLASRAKRYFPFAEGARDCLGRNLAAVSMATTLAMLLGRLSFSLADRVRRVLTMLP